MEAKAISISMYAKEIDGQPLSMKPVSLSSRKGGA
jgi:hypothetical protein